MRKLGEIFEIVATKAIEKGVAYLVNMNEPTSAIPEAPCHQCESLTKWLLCYSCRREHGIAEWEPREYAVIAWAIDSGVEVDIATGWPVDEPIPCTNE